MLGKTGVKTTPKRLQVNWKTTIREERRRISLQSKVTTQVWEAVWGWWFKMAPDLFLSCGNTNIEDNCVTFSLFFVCFSHRDKNIPSKHHPTNPPPPLSLHCKRLSHILSYCGSEIWHPHSQRGSQDFLRVTLHQHVDNERKCQRMSGCWGFPVLALVSISLHKQTAKTLFVQLLTVLSCTLSLPFPLFLVVTHSPAGLHII